ncbi:acyl-CoA dehydrogenase family protein [Mesorhizobium sp. ASY16-5R]|uniref:acyl-CoA dehydrogenase family protein n=1 Tax=Mesorhizobium sp. ASY16-5R TaxID=3445772 RepID=UPI003F9FF709
MDFLSFRADLDAAVTRFARDRLAPGIGVHIEDHSFPTRLVAEFGDLGLFGTAYDPAFGGAGLGVRGAALVTEALARVEPSFAAIYICHSAPASLLDRYASAELKEEWLRPANEGRFIGSFGVTEPHGGSDIANIRTRAIEDGDDFVLTGAKVFSTNAGTPPHRFTTVVAVTDPDKGGKGLSTFVVPVGTAGFSFGRRKSKIGWRVADSVELFLDEVRVPKANLIGRRGDGLKQVLTVLSVGRILVAAIGLGLARKALDLARDHGRERKLFGASILEHQGLAFPLADIATEIHAVELMIANAARLADDGIPFRTESSMTKLFASQLALKAATQSIQVHGGYGVFDEHAVAGLLGEAKVLEIVEGTSEMQRMVIARELLR